MFRAKFVYMGTTYSVCIGLIDLKFGMWVWDSVSHEEKLELNCYSMFRATLVDMVATSSVGFGPIFMTFDM